MKAIPSQKAFCQLCGQAIQNKGKSFHHPKWARDLALLVCLDCYQNKPRCQVCDLPVVAASANGVCATCEQYGKYCQACGQLLKRKYIEFEGVGLYCESCYRGRPPCDVCGAPLTEQQWQLSDGRVTCAHCHATAIYASEAAAALYEEMKTVATKTLGLKLNVPTGLALVDRNQLGEVIRQQQESMRNNHNARPGASTVDLNPTQTLGLYARRGIRRGIYVQTGLPRMLFLQVAAHEYAHAWQGENCPLLRELVVHEGFAEWVAYRILGYYGYTLGQERMKGRQDIYGQGLRWALDIEARHGAEGLILACQQAR